MADVGSLGQYKVVVTADYSQLKAQFDAMANFVKATTKTMSDGLDKSMTGINNKMLEQLKTTVDQLKKSFDGLGDAPKETGEKFKSYSQQIREATKEMQMAYQEQEKLQRQLEDIRSRSATNKSGYLNNSKEVKDTLIAIEQQKSLVADLTAEIESLRQEEQRYKNVLNQTALAEKQALADRKSLDKAEDEMIKRRNRQREGEVRETVRQAEEIRKAEEKKQQAVENANSKEEAIAKARSNQIARLQTQYRVAYDEINKYIQSHAKMSEAVFIRLQGKITSYGNQLCEISAIPQPPNPLEGMDYDKYSSQFSKWTDFFASLKHHVTWMASAAAIGLTLGVPAKTISTIAEVEKQMAQMKQVNEGVRNDQEILNKTAQDFIGIAERYGHSVDEIIKAGVLWGRAYKDLNTVMQLTNLSAKLAVADNMDVDLANRSIESVINAYQKQGEAITFATHVVDSWTKVAHNAQSSATDLAEALSRTGAAAKVVGVSFDTTTALASTMIKATGRSGAEVGRMIAA